MTDGTALTGNSIPGTVLSIDAMGGDEGPAAVVGGMAKAIDKNPELRFIVHGDRPELERLIEKRRGLSEKCEMRHTDDVVRMDEKPSSVLRQRQRHLHVVAIEAVRAGEAPVAVSCGNTGALMLMSMTRLRKIEGVNRPAIACLWPSRNPSGFNVMLDVGADLRADAEDLLQYALMGASYARNGLDLNSARAWAPERRHRGSQGPRRDQGRRRPDRPRRPGRRFRFRRLRRGRRPALRQGGRDRHGRLHRQRRAEDRRRHRADDPRVDGGGVPLFPAQPDRGASGLYLARRLSKRIDPRRVNGGVFLGLNGTVVKSHGGADATGVAAAIKLAARLAASGFNQRLAARISQAEHAARWPCRRTPTPAPGRNRHDAPRRGRGRGPLPARARGREREFEASLDTSDEWIRSRSGIERRHFAAEGETTSAMAVTAARARAGGAGLTPDDLDAVVVATSTPDLTFPSVATMVQARPRHAGGIRLRCAGGLRRIRLCARQCQRADPVGPGDRVVVIGAETFSRIMDWTDRGTCVLFGDGAGAVILEAQEGDGTPADRGILATDLNSDGRFRDLLYVDGGVSTSGDLRCPEDAGQGGFPPCR
jgi:glycerol-3-phosphate acyltransferase PlsX